MDIGKRRSVLYVPASRARALEKAHQRGADCLILDLEDGVAPQAKAEARQNLRGFMARRGAETTGVVIRINALTSDLGRQDLEVAAQVNPDAVLVPKINGPRDVHEAESALAAAGAASRVRLWVMMETPLAMLNAQEIAACAGAKAHQLAALVIGANDLYAGLRALPAPGRAGISGLLSPCVAAARAYGLDVIDGVYNDFADAEGFAAECRQGAVMGMDGKSLIHPAQIEICNQIFSPDEAHIRWAKDVIATFDKPENAKKGAISLDGRMVERLHLENAKRILELTGIHSSDGHKNK